MKDILKLMRVKHYIKNFLVFIPLFFSKNLFTVNLLIESFVGFLSFCFISSSVYILNDIQDIDLDKKHQKKKNRPLASGRISKQKAYILCTICFLASISLSLFLNNIYSLVILLAYLILNILYSKKLKNVPIIEIIILSSGFVLRVIYGGIITNIEISRWLYLVIVSGSMFMGLGKRRNELAKTKNTRKVLKYYNKEFLDKNMYVFISLVNTFYALWTYNSLDYRLCYTVPIMMAILMRYSYDIEGDSNGDPVDVILNDKILVLLGTCYFIIIFILLYLNIF